MRPCLVDVNVILALLSVNHQFHKAAVGWYDSRPAESVGLCRFTWLGTIRLLATPSVMHDDAVTAREALDVVQDLLVDERCEFLDEPPGIVSAMRDHLRYAVPTRQIVSDAYLAAFALRAQRQLVTLDRGFAQYRGLDLQILA